MTTPVVRVVGLGPGDPSLLTRRTIAALRDAPVARLRTRVHPAAEEFPDVASYDDWYDRATSFDVLYADIVEDLVALAKNSPDGVVVYAVPGSPVVAERTVELLRQRRDVLTICEPAVSIIDLACAALGRDPMTDELRIVDALSSSESLRGPGPLLVLQTHSCEVLATLADRLEPNTRVTVLHHLGLDDELVTELTARELVSFAATDHLTSLWVDDLRTAGAATDDLVGLMRRLRRDCPWDQEQTHASLTRHLLEEAYEALDALEAMVRVESGDIALDEVAAGRHVQEELGDLLFQIVFHAELGDEADRFNFATITDAVRDKLMLRHPHVFGDIRVLDSNDVAARWEVLKQNEKGRESVTDGIAWQLPALTLYTKLLRKAQLLDARVPSAELEKENARRSLGDLEVTGTAALDSDSTSNVAREWGDVLVALSRCAVLSGVDLEGVLRERAHELRDDIRRWEKSVTKEI